MLLIFGSFNSVKYYPRIWIKSLNRQAIAFKHKVEEKVKGKIFLFKLKRGNPIRKFLQVNYNVIILLQSQAIYKIHKARVSTSLVYFIIRPSTVRV